MAQTYDELHKKTVAQLRQIAKEMDHDALHGYSTMHKHDLVLALCTALGIDAHEHHDVIGIEKAKIKAQIKALKLKRDTALEAHDPAQLKEIRHRIKRLKRKIHKATF